MAENTKIDLSVLSEEELLNLRICDLPVAIEGSWLSECVQELYRELEDEGFVFMPVCYLADEWLAPDGEPVVGVPFFLADPALMRLEKKMMLEVEGGTHDWCMKLLRHETGHALNYAYRLHTRKKWRDVFGVFTKEYPDTYRFRPYSRNFVHHLENYYAQYHPDEDFAETFAVWLTKDAAWRTTYRHWKAYDKLTYVNELMARIKQETPPVPKGKPYWQAHRLRSTLRKYYKRKRQFYAEEFPDFHDANLQKMFFQAGTHNLPLPQASLVVAGVLSRHRRSMLDSVSRWTGERKYIIGQLIETIIARSRSLHLISYETESAVVLKVTSYITALAMNYLHTGKFRR